MTEAKRYGYVQVELVFPLEHEEWPVWRVGPKLPICPAEVDLVEQTPLAILEDLVDQSGWGWEPQFERGSIQ